MEERFTGAVERGEQRRVAAVADPYPDHAPEVAGTAGEQQKVLVFTDNDSDVGRRAVPDIGVRCLIQSDFKDVNAIQPPPAQVDG